MSISTVDLITKLNLATFWMNQMIPPIQIVFGTFGSLFNIIIFTRRTLRTNPCSAYFLASSVNNFFVIYTILFAHYLQVNWNLDPAATNNVLCKLRIISVYPPSSLILWFPVLASIDRFLSSSKNVRFRRLSSLPIARKIIVCTYIFFFLIHVHMPIFYKSDRIGNVFVCSVFSSEYLFFFNFFGPFVACILPIIFMSIFSVLIIHNVCSIHNRVVPQADNAQNERLRSNDRQLVRMLLVQVLVTVLISIPYVALCVYDVFVLVMLKYRIPTPGQEIFNFTYNFSMFLYYTNPVIGFYIYTLTGPKFCVEMKRCTKSGLKFTLTATGLIRWVPLRVQQALLADNQTNTINMAVVRSRRQNNVYPIQHRKPAAIMTSAV